MNRLYMIFILLFVICNPLAVEASLPIVGYKISEDEITYEAYRKPVVGADRASFQIINLEYAKDRNHIYYCGEILKGIDTNTFKRLSDRYIQDQNGIYFNGKRMLEVDVSSFEVLQDKDYPFVYQLAYAKDKNYVYFEDKIHLVDRDTFEVVGNGYTKDKDHVYFYNQAKPEFDAPTFELIGFYPIMHSEILSIDDIRFSHYRRNVYLKDKRGVYFYQEVNPKVPPEAGVQLLEVDVSTFEVLSRTEGFFGKDKNHAYYLGESIVEADVESFAVLDFGIRSEMKYSKDKNYLFVGTQKLGISSEEAIKKMDEEVQRGKK